MNSKNTKWLALAAISLSVLAAGLDITVLSVALPTLAVAIKASESDLQWFSSGYALALAAGMLPAGVLGDRFGRKKVLLGALILFAAGSVGCAYSTTSGEFIAARVALGLSGAAIIVQALASLTVLFSEEERPRAVGIWGAANFIALPVGPIFGGWLLSNFWWGWIFLMNVPVALIGFAAVLILVPESRAPERPALDPIGMLAASAGLAGVTYGLIELGRNGWTDPPSLAVAIAGVALIIGFFLWENYLTARPNGRPLIDLSLFQSRGYTWGVILAALGGMALFGLVFTLPQYTQGVLGLDPMGSGVRLLPAVIGLIVGALPADRLSARIGSKLTVGAGFAITAAGLLMGATTSVDSSTAFEVGWMAVVGLGMGIGFVTAASAALKTVPAEHSGVASAVLQAIQKVGAPFGSAILGSVLVTAYQANLNLQGFTPAIASTVKLSVFAGDAVARHLHSATLLASVHQSFVQAMDTSLAVSAVFAAVATLLALVFLPGRRAAAALSEEAGIKVGRVA